MADFTLKVSTVECRATYTTTLTQLALSDSMTISDVVAFVLTHAAQARKVLRQDRNALAALMFREREVTLIEAEPDDLPLSKN